MPELLEPLEAAFQRGAYGREAGREAALQHGQGEADIAVALVVGAPAHLRDFGDAI